MHNGKIIILETTPKTVSADRIAGSAPPINRARSGTRGLEFLDERAGWAEKPGMHVVLGWIKPSGKPGDNPSDPTTFGVCATQ
jgi:hypothetical protein